MIIKKLLCILTHRHSWRRPRKGEAAGIKTCRRCGETVVIRTREAKSKEAECQ